MDTRIKQSLISGILATIVMTVIMLIAPMMGMPEMNPASMLAEVMAVPLIVGWIMHFIVGIIFAAFYVYIFHPKINIQSAVGKGALYGIIIFIFAQVVMGAMGALVGGMPQPQGSMALIITGSIIGHVVFGLVVALLVKKID
ncbi:MAG: DUF6789 family protein [Cyclobacteriaceae bacterium]